MTKNRALMVYIEPTPYIVRLIKELMEKGDWQIEVLFITQNLSQQWNIQLTGICYDILPEGLWKSFMVVAGKLRHGTYDVLHLAGWGHLQMLLALFVGKLVRVPVLMETDTPLPYRLSFMKRALKRMIYPWLFSLTTKFLPGGSKQAQYLRHYQVPDNRIRIAYMTVDTTAISAHIDTMPEEQRNALRCVHGIGPLNIVFLYVGRMEPHKGIKNLLQAFKQVRCTTAENCHLILVGDGSMRDEVLNASGEQQGIHYLGRLSGIELLNAYALSDIFVLPSLFEPWGLVVNEAMAANLPVIASDRAGCVDDLIVSGETGFVVEAESIDRLVTAMELVALNPEEAMSMGKKARKHITPWTTTRRANVMHATWQEVSS